ncbi:helix-turn-helix transcriptional regulator [Micromonospora sp. M12]
MTTDDDAARDLLETALATPNVEQWPFDLARAPGVRQAVAPAAEIAAAREQLTIAHDALGALVPDLAGPSCQRATRHWDDAPCGSDAGLPALTAQEREIADLAGTGLTNKQIAQKLLISHRTVSDHLYKLFPSWESRRVRPYGMLWARTTSGASFCPDAGTVCPGPCSGRLRRQLGLLGLRAVEVHAPGLIVLQRGRPSRVQVCTQTRRTGWNCGQRSARLHARCNATVSRWPPKPWPTNAGKRPK